MFIEFTWIVTAIESIQTVLNIERNPKFSMMSVIIVFIFWACKNKQFPQLQHKDKNRE